MTGRSNGRSGATRLSFRRASLPIASCVSVREDASHREAIAFPWRLLAGGIALSLAVGFLGAPVPEDVVSASVSDVSPRVALAAQWSALTLGGSFLLAWWAARFVRIS